MSTVKSLEQAKKLHMQVSTFGGQDREIIAHYAVAESASQMPWMSDDEFSELQQSIAEHGLKSKILLNHNDEIVDGRHRMLACLAQDVDPEFDFIDSDEQAAVDIFNLRRRHLTPGQRAALYVRLTGLAQASVDNLDDLDLDAETELPDITESNPQQTAPVASPVPAKADKPESQPATKTTREQAKEAGVAERTMRQAKTAMSKGVPEVQDAVLKGELPVHEAEKIAQKEPEQQRAELAERSSTARPRRERPTEAQFDLNGWARGQENRIHKVLANVPPSLRDTCHRRLGEMLNVTVRMEKDTPDLMNAEGVVPYVEQLIKEMAKSERPGAEKALADRFGAVAAKDADEAMQRITAIVEGLAEREKKKVIVALGGKFKPEPSSKPAEYLPALPETGEDAVDVVVKEVKVRTEQLSAIPEVDCAPLVSQLTKSAKKLPRKTGMES